MLISCAPQIDNVLQLLCHVLSERKIVLFSNDYGLLTPAAEALRAIIFPFQWQFGFIPVSAITVASRQ